MLRSQGRVARFDRTARLGRIENAVSEVVKDLHRHIEGRPSLVHSGQTKLVSDHTPDELSGRYFRGMPAPLKLAFGRENGIDFDELIPLTAEPSCSPDKKSVGSYFIFGRSARASKSPPSPIYGGESKSVKVGISLRTDQHLSPGYRAKESTKPLYMILDDPDAPQTPYALVTCRETVIDAAFERFAEIVTRQLLGCNADVPANRELRDLPSYGILKFASPVIPTNHTNALRESFDANKHDHVTLAERQVAYNKRAATLLHESRERKRTKHVCNNCGTGDSSPWFNDPSTLDAHICSSCYFWNLTHGQLPTADEVANLAERRADKEKRHPTPGWCENENCRTEETRAWYWDATRAFWVCFTCWDYAKTHSDALRVPARRRRKASEKNAPCANELCGATDARWRWSDVLKNFVCSPCIDFFQRNG